MSSLDQQLYEQKTINNILLAKIQRLERRVCILECSNPSANKNFVEKVEKIEKNLDLLKIKINNKNNSSDIFLENIYNQENELKDLLNFSVNEIENNMIKDK